MPSLFDKVTKPFKKAANKLGLSDATGVATLINPGLGIASAALDITGKNPFARGTARDDAAAVSSPLTHNEFSSLFASLTKPGNETLTVGAAARQLGLRKPEAVAHNTPTLSDLVKPIRERRKRQAGLSSADASLTAASPAAKTPDDTELSSLTATNKQKNLENISLTQG